VPGYFIRLLSFLVAFSLKVERFGIKAFEFKQFLMISLLNNFSLINDDNSLGVTNSGKTMRNNNQGFIFNSFVETVKDFTLRNSVDGGGGFIKKNDRAIPIKYPSDGNFLHLSPGRFFATVAVAHRGIKTLRIFVYELSIGFFEGSDNFGIVSALRSADGDVFPEGKILIMIKFLGKIGQLMIPIFKFNFFKVDTID